MKVFLCYEENCPSLAIECDAISDIAIYSSAEKALEWFKGRIKEGIGNDFVIDASDSKYTAENLYNEVALRKEIMAGSASLTMFLHEQERWNDCYTICVAEKPVL